MLRVLRYEVICGEENTVSVPLSSQIIAFKYTPWRDSWSVWALCPTPRDRNAPTPMQNRKILVMPTGPGLEEVAAERSLRGRRVLYIGSDIDNDSETVYHAFEIVQ